MDTKRPLLSSGKERAPLEQFPVGLEDPVDVYRLTERATKYAGMFIVLTFEAFFVLEMVKRWRIHPMQYLMIGAALVLFFLLLLSLAEQLGFFVAYLAASAGCIALLTHYLVTCWVAGGPRWASVACWWRFTACSTASCNRRTTR